MCALFGKIGHGAECPFDSDRNRRLWVDPKYCNGFVLRSSVSHSLAHFHASAYVHVVRRENLPGPSESAFLEVSRNSVFDRGCR